MQWVIPGGYESEYEYEYDLAGNRTWMERDGVETTYTYNVRNEIVTKTTGTDVTSYVHDENGNRVEKSVNTGVDTDYFYDTSNRLVSADVDGAPAFEATYDYRTRRVSKTEGGDVTIFRYDGGVSFDEWKDTGGDGVFLKQVEFVRGSGMGGGIGSILYSDREVPDGQGGTVTEREYFVYSPAVGHTVATLKEDETVKSTNLYEAFGNVVKLDAGTWIKSDGPTTGASDNNRLANTKERDASIGLDNHGRRYYDPEIGRYTTRDPIGYGDGLNVYLSVHNNPINFMDPLGLNENETTKRIRRTKEIFEGLVEDAKHDVEGRRADLAKAVARKDESRAWLRELVGESRAACKKHLETGDWDYAKQVNRLDKEWKEEFKRYNALLDAEFQAKIELRGAQEVLAGLSQESARATRAWKQREAWAKTGQDYLLDVAPEVSARTRGGIDAFYRINYEVAKEIILSKGMGVLARAVKFGPTVTTVVGAAGRRKKDIKYIDYVVKAERLTRKARRILHDEISGRNLSRSEIQAIARDIAKNMNK